MDFSITIPKLPSKHDRRKKPRRKEDSTPKKPTVKPAAKPSGKPPKDVLEKYTPRRRVKYIGTQLCPCCQKRIRFIAADLLEYYTADTCAGHKTIRTKAFNKSDYRFKDIKLDLEFLDEEKEKCASCLIEEEIIDEVFEPRHGLQLPLFL